MTHIPVLLNEIIEHLHTHPPKLYLDATFGRGGHSHKILQTFTDCKVLAVDQDDEAIVYAKENYKSYIEEERLFLLHSNFESTEQIKQFAKDKLNTTCFDGILVDLGVSSPQLDQPQRGFSFYHDGPLDMRMDRRGEITAADIVNTWSEQELVELFQQLGEVHRPQRVVRAIVEDRGSEAFTTTRQLSGLIERVQGWRRKGHHPATQFFLALRLEVNRELEVIEKVIPSLIDLLSDKGLLMIISFHSLEDRIVKQSFKKQLDSGELVNKKVIQEKWEMKKSNPRSRSAKLRIYRRLLNKTQT